LNSAERQLDSDRRRLELERELELAVEQLPCC
jgi:hypothetical protein